MCSISISIVFNDYFIEWQEFNLRINNTTSLPYCVLNNNLLITMKMFIT